MDIASKNNADTKIFFISGAISGAAGWELFNQLKVQAYGQYGRIVIDLRSVPYIDSLGMGSLVDLHQIFRDVNKKLVLAAPSDLMRELFLECCLGEIFEVIDPKNLPLDLA